jgi:hypothetical protein
VDLVLREVMPWQVGLGALLLVGAGAAGGFVMARELETREERLARRYVVADRAWRTCSGRSVTPGALSFDDLIWVAEGCEREAVELDIAHAAIQMVSRTR